MNKSTIVLYQAYGSINIYHQVSFSILTLYYQLQGNFDNIKVVVYTDSKSNFKYFDGKIPIFFEPLSNKDLIAFKGSYSFIHRVKICIVDDCFKKYGSNIFYLDSDTYFTEHPRQLFSQISPGQSIMNSNDYDLTDAAVQYENSDWLKIRKAIKNNTYSIDNNIQKIPLTTRMWNAGVIGIDYSNAGLLPLILDLTDQIYKYVKVFTAEQFAFSFYLQNKTLLLSSGQTVYHYWQNHAGQYWKDAYSKELSKLFRKNKSKSIHELSKLAHDLTLEHDNIVSGYNPSFIFKVKKRIKMILQVARQGKL